MRPERNPLDLNNLPEDYTRDVFEDSRSSSGYGEKKSGGKEGKDKSGKVYECRFCSLKFCKSQALGGHMNRHRQERETETLNRARQLVFSNDNLTPQMAHHLGDQPIPHGGYHQTVNMVDPTILPFKPFYPARLFFGASPTLLPSPPPPPPPLPPPPHQSYIYSSTSRFVFHPSQYPPRGSNPVNDYFVGRVLSGNPQYGHSSSNSVLAPPDASYTCLGAPVGHVFAPGSGGADFPIW